MVSFHFKGKPDGKSMEGLFDDLIGAMNKHVDFASITLHAHSRPPMILAVPAIFKSWPALLRTIKPTRASADSRNPQQRRNAGSPGRRRRRHKRSDRRRPPRMRTADNRGGSSAPRRDRRGPGLCPLGLTGIKVHNSVPRIFQLEMIILCVSLFVVECLPRGHRYMIVA